MDPDDTNGGQGLLRMDRIRVVHEVEGHSGDPDVGGGESISWEE